MATNTRQYGRRGFTNTTNQSTGRFVPSSSTTSASVPPRRYVLDIPSRRTQRTSRASRLDEMYRETETRSRSAGGTSRDFYYRDYTTEPSASTVNRYFEDGNTYANTFVDDQEVQALTAQATPDVKNYPINIDSNPEIIVRPNTERLTYTQDIALRYLKPSTPPPPGVINQKIDSSLKYISFFFLNSL